MRVTVAAVTAITALFVGVTAISESAQQAQPTLSSANSSAANASYNLSVGVFTGASQAGIGIVWFGVGAIVVVALGMLVMAGRSGGR